MLSMPPTMTRLGLARANCPVGQHHGHHARGTGLVERRGTDRGRQAAEDRHLPRRVHAQAGGDAIAHENLVELVGRDSTTSALTQVAPSCGAATAARTPMNASIPVRTPATITVSVVALVLVPQPRGSCSPPVTRPGIPQPTVRHGLRRTRDPSFTVPPSCVHLI
jgi:hypothetical protein